MANEYGALFDEDEKRLKSNPYGPLFDQDAGRGSIRIRDAASTTPEAFTKGVTQSRATGVPLPVVLRNPQEAGVLAREAQTKQVLEKYPTLGPILLQDEGAAKTLIEDAATLGPLTENPIFKKKPTAADFPIGPKRSFLEASKQLIDAEAKHNQAVRDRLDREARIWAEMDLEEESDLLKGTRSFAEESPHLASVLRGIISTGSGLWGAVEWTAAQLGMDYHAGAAGSIQDVANRYAAALQAEVSKQHFMDSNEKLDWVFTKTLENAPSLVLSLGGILNPNTMSFVLGSLSATEGGQQYHELVKKGVDPSIAATAGAGYAVVAALTEKLPIEMGSVILKRYAALPVAAQHQIAHRLLYGTAFVGAVGGVEGLEEVASLEGQRWIDAATGGLQMAYGGGGTVGEKLAATRSSLFTKDMVDAFMGGLGGGMSVGGVLGGATVVGLLAAPDMTKIVAEQEAALAKAQASDKFAQDIAAAGLTVSQTKAASLAPAGMEALAKAMEGMNPDGKVVVDANVFAQVLEQTATPLAPIVAVSPAIRDQLVNARAMKSDLIIPTGEFLAGLATTPAFASLIPHVKPDTNAFSQEETKVYLQEQAKLLEKEIAAIIERNAAKAPFVAGGQQVYDTVLADLERTGRFTSDVNKVYATFMQRFFMATAEKLSVTPDVLFNTYQLGTTAEALDKEGRFDQLAPATLDDFRPGNITGILNRSRWTILEAGNPMGKADTPENNAAAMAKLKAMLDERGLEYVDTIGRYGNVAPGVLVLGMAEDDAVALGREFGQESVLVRRGLAYGDDTLDATTGTVEEITPGPDDDYYTTIPSLGTSFRVGIDFNNRQARGSNALDQSASVRSGRETLKKYGLHPGVKYTVREVAAALEARQRAKYGSIDAKDRSEEATKKIAKWMVEEILFEMENPGRSGVGWYSDKFQRGLDKFGELFPELLTDKTARDIFTLLIAITSDGAKVMANAALAVDIYSGYRETGKIELSGTDHNRDLDANIARVQELIDTLGAENVAPYLLQEATVKELKAIAAEKGLKFNTAYTVDTLLPLSAVLLGPKLGAFYANLMGSHGYLTMDRWWSRTFNRYRGTLVSAPTKAGLDRFRALINQPWLTDDEAIAATIPYCEAYKARDYKDGTEVEKAANTLYKFAFENLNDKPFNSTDRNFMIAAAREAQKMLKRRGHDISIADIQAILWYYEKKLYGELGTREPGGISYEEAAELITRESAGSATGRSSARSVGQAAAQDVDPGAPAFAAEPGVLNQDSRAPLDGIVGIHFSSGERTALDGSHYGEGAEGAERRRVMAAADTRLRERVHFYVSTGQGVFPETGVGATAHRSTLDNLYDADVDPLGLFRGASTDAQLNAAESAVIDEGYSGYLSRAAFGRQGTAVLLGPGSRNVDTTSVGGLTEANAQADVAPAARYSDAQLLAQKVQALKSKLPAGALDAAGWRRYLGMLAPDLLPQVEASGALERLTGPAYLSEVTTNIYRQDEDAPRGQIRFGDDITQQRSIISILQKADLSTVLHELGHFYFEVTRDLATKIQTKADAGQAITAGEQSILNDMNALLKFVGVEAGQSPAGGNQTGTLNQAPTGKTAKARAKSLGFDVNDTLYHWRAREAAVMRPFTHVGTQQAADDRYMMPAGNGLSGLELMARVQHGLPAEGAVYPVWINKTKVLRLAEDTGQHDALNIAWSVGKALNDPTLVDKLIELAINGMHEDQLIAWSEEAGYDYLRASSEDGFVADDYRTILRQDFARAYGQSRGTDGSIQDGGLLAKHSNRTALEGALLGYLSDRGITALSYVNDVEDPGSISYIIPDQRNVRSIHAKFEGTGQFDMLDQSSTDLVPTLRTEAAKQLPAFTAFISDLATATGTEALLPPPGFEVKGEGRIRAKVDGEYGGDARRVMDALRGTLLADNRAALDRGYAALAGLETRKLKNFVDTPTELGYRAIIAVVVLNGVPSEVQVVPRQIQEVKDRVHKQYERWQDLQRDSAKRQLTPEEIAESDQLAAFMRGEFEPAFIAWNAASEISEASMPSGAMEMGLPSGTSNASTAPGEPSLVSSTETGTSIQSKYLIGGPSVIEGATSVYQGAAPAGTSPGGSRLDTWNAMSFEQRRAGHELIARAFEAYLFKGKAPTLELTGVFQRVKAWMLAVYKDITALGVEPSPEVAEVFDRWLASEAAIEATHTARNFAPLFSTKPPGMTDEEWLDYQGKVANGAGMADAQDQLTARSLRDMQWVNNQMARELRKLRKDAAVKRRQVRAEVANEVYQEPVYAADRFLRHGILPEGDKVEGAKLDMNALREMYGNDANAPWRYLPTGPNGLAGVEGLHPDTVAEMFGFDSGDALVRALLAAEPIESAIDGQTDQRMLERYGDLSDEQSMKRAAEAAMHNEARGNFIATEMSALAKMIGKPRMMAKAAKEFAAAMIGRKRLRDIQPSQFEVAEAAAAKRAEKALAADNLVEAATEKRNQLVNFYAAKAAHEALEAGERALRYLKKFGNKGTRKNIDPGYLEQIDGILDAIDLRRLTQKEMDGRTSLRDWIAAQERAGLEPVVDPDLLERIGRKPFKELSVDELQGLVDSVKNIEHLGRLKRKLLTAKDAREFAERRDALVGSIVDNANRTVDQSIEFNSKSERTKELWRKFAAAHRKIASRAREMDGGKTGLFWELIIRPMNAAGNMEAVMREEATQKLAALFRPLGLGHGWTKKMQVPGTNFSLSREGRIMLVLNMGNEGNRQRLRDGGLDGKRALTEADMQAVLNTLTKEEMDFVQGVWDLLESYRPLIAAQEKRLTGLVPKWVESLPIETRHGTYRGGYFPAKYEGRQSTRSAALEAATDLRQAMQGVFGRAGARNSYTKARAAEVNGRPLRKDFGVIAQHLNEVIHRLSWQDWLIDATRLVNDRKVDAVIREHYGDEALTDIRDTLTDLARGDLPPQGPVDKIIRHLRVGTSIAGMGWNVVTALLQPSGAMQSIKRIGAGWFTRGMNEYLQHPVKKIEEVFAKSDMMRLRSKTLQREISEILNTVKEGETVTGVRASLFWMISKLQLQVDMPTWLGAYQSALQELKMENAATAEERAKIEDTAVAMADQAVLDTQGGGQLKDLAAVQRGSEGQRLFTNFYSFFNTTYNLTAEAGRTESAWKMPGTFLLLFTIPALYSVALKELLKGECDAEMDCLAEKLARENLSYMFGTMILFREMASALQGFTGYSGPAGTRFFSETAKLVKQAEQGDVDVALVKAAIMATSIPLHLPGTAITRMVEGVDALAEGETDNILSPFVGVPRP